MNKYIFRYFHESYYSYEKINVTRCIVSIMFRNLLAFIIIWNTKKIIEASLEFIDAVFSVKVHVVMIIEQFEETTPFSERLHQHRELPWGV